MLKTLILSAVLILGLTAALLVTVLAGSPRGTVRPFDRFTTGGAVTLVYPHGDTWSYIGTGTSWQSNFQAG